MRVTPSFFRTHRAIKPSQGQQGTKERLGVTFKLHWVANKPQAVNREREDDLNSRFPFPTEARTASVAWVGAEDKGIKPSQQKQGTEEHLG